MSKKEEVEKLGLTPIDATQALLFLVESIGRVALVEPPWYSILSEVFSFEEAAIRVRFSVKSKCFKQRFLSTVGISKDIHVTANNLKEFAIREEDTLRPNSIGRGVEVAADNWHDLNWYVPKIWLS